MSVNQKKLVRRELIGALAAVLALSLAACEQKPSAENIGKSIDNSVEKANRQIEKAAASAEKKLDQTGATIRETTADAGKVIGDSALTAKVKAALIAEPGLKALKIDVNTVDGIVTLNGIVDTAANRDRAVQVTTGVQGVKSVKDSLVVKAS